mmetsp:Transcript_27650/g.50202  ORF Transcript_27650/g.50202 Transcript_27650/m.50202 type:complete len:287 (-) Transcript_27650:426-1286(-)
MDEFKWFNSKEDSSANRQAYMNYLGTNVSWPAGHCVTDCNAYKNLLSGTGLDGKHKISGNIDVVLVAQEDAENGAIRQNIRAGIELKKGTNSGNHEHQVVLQHLAASSLNPEESVLTVMTDLNQRWHFYWFGRNRKKMYKYVVSASSQAKFLFEHMFDSPDDCIDGIDASTLFPTDFLVRGTWRMFLESELMTIRESQTDDSGSDHDSTPGSGQSRRGGLDIPAQTRTTRGSSRMTAKGEGHMNIRSQGIVMVWMLQMSLIFWISSMRRKNGQCCSDSLPSMLFPT